MGAMAGTGLTLSLLVVCWTLVNCDTSDTELDPNGYILFCPCMGRFGNQAEHYLGALAFAKGLDRTLVLPPWVEYPPGSRKSSQIPFKTYFRVDAVQEYHRVIPMEDFMETLAPKIWPVGKRTVYCYATRPGGKEDGCNAKEGNPFGPFWDTYNIDFDQSEFYGPLHYEVDHQHVLDDWNKKFPSKDHYVMAFTGAPGSFPIRQSNVPLHKYLVWSDFIQDKAKAFIKKEMPEGPFLGLHMRNGVDWKSACEHVSSSSTRNLFGSAQCLGYRMEHGDLTEELCFPSDSTVLNQIKKAVKKIKAKAIFVAADNDHMISKIQKKLKSKIPVVKYQPSEPHVDLAILQMADHYIGNCVSTFSAFATRSRRVQNKTCDFWGFTPKQHDEL